VVAALVAGAAGVLEQAAVAIKAATVMLAAATLCLMCVFRWIVLSGDAALPAAVHAGQAAVAELWLICVMDGLIPALPMGG